MAALQRAEAKSPSSPYTPSSLYPNKSGVGRDFGVTVQEEIAWAHTRIRANPTVSALKARFDAADADADGFVSKADFIRLRSVLFPPDADRVFSTAREEDLSGLFPKLDEDSDGYLSWLEFLNYYCQLRPHEMMPRDWLTSFRNVVAGEGGSSALDLEIKRHNHAAYNVFAANTRAAFKSPAKSKSHGPVSPLFNQSTASPFRGSPFAMSPAGLQRTPFSPGNASVEKAVARLQRNPALWHLKQAFDAADANKNGLISRTAWETGACKALFPEVMSWGPSEISNL